MKVFLAFLLLANSYCFGQPAKKYIGYEGREEIVDSAGKVWYHPSSLYPWVYEVVITISGTNVQMQKHPFYLNEKQERIFADSITNTYRYSGILQQMGDIAVVRMQLMKGSSGYIYIDGKVTYEANNYFIPNQAIVGRFFNLKTFQFTEGRIPMMKKFLQPVIVISEIKEESIYVNGNFYRRM